MIRREIEVTRKGLPILLNVTYGTDLIEIGFKITDFVIPAQATATAYNQGKSAEVHKQICSIKDNTISFTPKKGFFEEGHNELQFRVVHNNRNLFSFKSRVECQGSFVDDDANEIKNNPTLVEQLLTEQGILKTRFDEALRIPEGGTTADAALNDIKVGEDGTVYGSPGEAVRQQTKKAREMAVKNAVDIGKISEQISHKANVIIERASGATVALTDSSDRKLDGLRVFGKNEQAEYTGKNLIPYPYIKGDTEASGLTFTHSYTEVKCAGTATANVWHPLAEKIKLNKGTYKISGCDKGGSSTTYYLIFRRADNTADKTAVDYGTGAIFTITDETVEYNLYLGVMTGTIIDSTFKPMIQLNSIADNTYEPYVGGIPSPNTSYPQDVISVGNDGTLDIAAYGKNLIKYPYKDSSCNNNGITWIDNGDGSITANGTATADSAFLLVSPITLEKGVFKLSGFEEYKSGCAVQLSYSNVWVSCEAVSPRIFTINEKTKFTYNRLLVKKGVTVENAIFKPMLCISTINDNNYELYKDKRFLSISTPNGLSGIMVNDMSLANYTDSNGDMWCADEIDFKRGVHIQRVNTITFNGSENIMLDRINDYDIANFYYNLPLVGGASEALSSHFRVTTLPIAYVKENCFLVSENYKTIYLRINKEQASTIEQFKAYLTEQYNNGTPVTISYILKSPIVKSLSENQLSQYNAFMTKYPTTTIISEDSAHMEIDYAADTKGYIDKKFTELAQQMV